MKLIKLFIPSATLLTTTSLSLLSNSPNYLRELEIHFYDSSESSERLIIFVDDVMQISKAKYHESSGSQWKALNLVSDSTKYTKLFKIASEFVKAQHYLNITKIINFYKNSNNKAADVECCKECPCKTCCSEDKVCCYCCADCICGQKEKCNLEETQKKFGYFLSNLNSAYKNIYLSPVQAHIKLIDKQISNLSNETNEIEFVGSVVYGFVNYKYQEVKNVSADTFDNQFLNNNTQTTESNKYFANIPQKLKVSLGSNGSSENNTKKIINELSDKNKISDLASNSSQSTTTSCSDQNIQSLIARNYVIEENLENIRNMVKCKCGAKSKK